MTLSPGIGLYIHGWLWYWRRGTDGDIKMRSSKMLFSGIAGCVLLGGRVSSVKDL